jgi:hypothetical protein
MRVISMRFILIPLQHCIPMPSLPEYETWPRTLQDAVDLLVYTLSPVEKHAIAARSEDDLIDLHFVLGVKIREDFGLWRGNRALLQSCGSLDPDDASMAIIRALWARLRH